MTTKTGKTSAAVVSLSGASAGQTVSLSGATAAKTVSIGGASAAKSSGVVGIGSEFTGNIGLAFDATRMLALSISTGLAMSNSVWFGKTAQA